VVAEAKPTVRDKYEPYQIIQQAFQEQKRKNRRKKCINN
jgi:hypothetical protein